MVLRMQIMLRKSCHRTLNNSKITAGGPCIPHPLGWGGRPQFDFTFLGVGQKYPSCSNEQSKRRIRLIIFLKKVLTFRKIKMLFLYQSDIHPPPLLESIQVLHSN